MPTNNQIAHAFVTVPGVAPAIAVVRADGCDVQHTGLGTFTVDTPAGFSSVAQNLKVTTNVEGVAGAATIVNLSWISQTQLEVLTFDAAGEAADPASLWVSIEVVPKVS